MILRILAAAVLASTGHAGASALVAVLLIAARVIRTLLPVLPQLTVTGVLLAIVLLLAVVLKASRFRSSPYPRGRPRAAWATP